eukprot:TRINITY_DN975_c0_g1_i2.p3 TRINITY_DN975_c0_g1~~TRINITY_DN975_c0_g1_i2.p3  ORF type:complete len:95 (+),score=45.56 TRINITY_DN975_c0_g1_i2:490-774(+)
MLPEYIPDLVPSEKDVHASPKQHLHNPSVDEIGQADEPIKDGKVEESIIEQIDTPMESQPVANLVEDQPVEKKPKKKKYRLRGRSSETAKAHRG